MPKPGYLPGEKGPIPRVPIFSMEEVASYIIFREGELTKAKNGQTGLIDFSGTDASTVIQSAINALTSGGKIFIKAGTYLITSEILLPSNLNIEGEGRSLYSATTVGGTILELGYDGNIFKNKDNPTIATRIARLTINGKRATRTLGTGIYGKFRTCLFEDLHIYDMDESGIIIEDTANAVACWDNRLVNCDINWVDEYCVKCGTRGTDLVIIGGTLEQAGLADLYFQGVGGHFLTGVVFVAGQYCILSEGGGFKALSCNLEAAGKHNVYLKALAGVKMETVSILGGTCVGAGTEASNTYSGIYIEGFGANDDENARNIIVEGVYFNSAGITKYCVEVAHGGVEIYERDITVVGNDMRWGYVTAGMNAIPPSSHIHYNDGFVTENSGTATAVPDVDTEIAHAMDIEPTFVTLTPLAVGVEGYAQLVTKSATSITIRANVSGVDVAWKGETV